MNTLNTKQSRRAAAQLALPSVRRAARALVFLLAFVGAFGVAATAQAGEKDGFSPELRFSLGGAFVAPQVQSYGWVEDEIAARQDFSVGVTPVQGLTLQLEYSAGRSSAYRAGGLDTSLFAHGVGVRVRYALDCGGIVRPYLTTGLGASVGMVRIDGPSRALRDRTTAFFGDFAAGMEVQSRGKVSIGAYQDFGYAIRTPYNFDDARTDDGSAAVDLGDIQLRGVQYRIGIFVATEF